MPHRMPEPAWARPRPRTSSTTPRTPQVMTCCPPAPTSARPPRGIWPGVRRSGRCWPGCCPSSTTPTIRPAVPHCPATSPVARPSSTVIDVCCTSATRSRDCCSRRAATSRTTGPSWRRPCGKCVRRPGIRPGNLCLPPQFLGAPIDIDVHAIDANPAKGEGAHRHFDFRFAFYLVTEEPLPLALQDSAADVAPPGAAADPAAARAVMVAQVEEEGTLGPGPVRDALLVLPREVLMPQAYVRRSASGETPPRWGLLDWAAVPVCSSSTTGNRSWAGRADHGRGRPSRRCPP